MFCDRRGSSKRPGFSRLSTLILGICDEAGAREWISSNAAAECGAGGATHHAVAPVADMMRIEALQ